MDSQAYIIKITVDYNIHVAKNFGPTGKVRILIRTEIRILPVSTSADPHIRILPQAVLTYLVLISCQSYSICFINFQFLFVSLCAHVKYLHILRFCMYCTFGTVGCCTVPTSDVNFPEKNISQHEKFFPRMSSRSRVRCKVVSLKDANNNSLHAW